MEVDPWEPNDISVLGHDTKEARDERMRSLKERVRAGIFLTGACGGEGYIQEEMDWSVNTGENTVPWIEVSNPLELLAVFLSHPRTASNLNMYPRVLQIEGCDQREHFEDERIHVSQTSASRRLRSKRALRGRANKFE